MYVWKTAGAPHTPVSSSISALAKKLNSCFQPDRGHTFCIILPGPAEHLRVSKEAPAYRSSQCSGHVTQVPGGGWL